MGTGLRHPDPSTLRLVVTDFDGTIYGPKQPLSRETKEAAALLRASGRGVSAATGRNYWEARELVNELGIDLPVILANGAQIYHFGEERLLYSKAFHLPTLREFFTGLLPGTGISLRWLGGGRWREATLAQFLELEPGQVRRVLLVDPDQRLDLTDSDACPYWIFRDGSGLIELTPKAVHKGEGLVVLCSLLGLEPWEVVALGNDRNDLELLETAGVGLAVLGGHPELVAKARGITAPLEEHPLRKIADWLLGSTPWERIVMRK